VPGTIKAVSGVYQSSVRWLSKQCPAVTKQCTAAITGVPGSIKAMSGDYQNSARQLPNNVRLLLRQYPVTIKAVFGCYHKSVRIYYQSISWLLSNQCPVTIKPVFGNYQSSVAVLKVVYGSYYKGGRSLWMQCAAVREAVTA
jgi:hypothetical protein